MLRSLPPRPPRLHGSASRRARGQRILLHPLLSQSYSRVVRLCSLPWPHHAAADKIEVVEGDVKQEYLGLTQEKYLQLASEVTYVLNCAANVEFNEPLKKIVQVRLLSSGAALRPAAAHA